MKRLMLMLASELPIEQLRENKSIMLSDCDSTDCPFFLPLSM